MTAWYDPQWRPADLVPARLHGQALSTAEIARRAAEAAPAWDRRASPAGEGSAYVLVGGAGFLGVRIAARLLAEPDDAPVVLVSRYPNSVFRHGMLRPSPRLILVEADVAAGRRDWLAAIPRARIVFHLAAAVHALAGWERLAPVNLAGLGASVALARRDGALLQLASILSVFVSSNARDADAAETLRDRTIFGSTAAIAQTKAAAEMALAGLDDLRWQVIRYGLLVPDAGAPFPPQHFAPAFLRALDRLGAVPDRAEAASVDLTPVDAAAGAAIRLARDGAPCWRHWANRRSAQLADVVAAIEAVRGRFPRCAMAEWLVRLRPLPRMERALLRSAFDKSGFLAEDAAVSPILNVDLFQSTLRRFLPADAGQDAPPAPPILLPGVIGSMLTSLAQEGA